MTRKRSKKGKKAKASDPTVKPRLLEDRRWCSDRRMDDRRQQDLSVEEERRAAEDRRSSENRRGDTDRRRGNRRCGFRLDGDEPCKALAVMRDPTTKEWRCMEHLEVSPETP